MLLEHEWPGNVREMANVMEHAYILSGGQRIAPEHLPHHIRPMTGAPTLSLAPAAGVGAPPGARTLRDIEMEHILRVLEKPPGGGRNGISTLNYLDWQRQNTVFDCMAAQTIHLEGKAYVIVERAEYERLATLAKAVELPPMPRVIKPVPSLASMNRSRPIFGSGSTR